MDFVCTKSVGQHSSSFLTQLAEKQVRLAENVVGRVQDSFFGMYIVQQE
jgi:hypothetical protein